MEVENTIDILATRVAQYRAELIAARQKLDTANAQIAKLNGQVADLEKRIAQESK